MTSSLLAGVISSLVGLLVFLVVHHVWIKPIWFITPVGFVLAAALGLAIGWAYFHIREGLPAAPWRTPAMFAVIVCMLAPGALLSFSHGPLFDLTTAKIPAGE